MPKTAMHKVICYIILGITVCVSGNACRSTVQRPAAVPESIPVESVLVIPFKNMAAVYGENVSVRCPLDGKVYMTGKVAGDAENTLTSHLVMLITDRCECRMIPPSNALGVISELTRQDRKVLPEKKLLAEIGRILGADAVVTGHIYRFQERRGRKYSVESPAAVTFDIHIIKVNGGGIIWSGKFDETQKSLDKNLFNLTRFIKRRGRWITARHMAVTGLDDLFEEIPLTGR